MTASGTFTSGLSSDRRDPLTFAHGGKCHPGKKKRLGHGEMNCKLPIALVATF